MGEYPSLPVSFSVERDTITTLAILARGGLVVMATHNSNVRPTIVAAAGIPNTAAAKKRGSVL
jgi:hypothetical protein